jgi:hypothetical protein
VDTFIKDPNSVQDYVQPWDLGDDTIATSTWIVGTGLTKDSDSHDDTSATLWLSGGTLGEEYTATNRITTTGGRTYDRTIRFLIREK